MALREKTQTAGTKLAVAVTAHCYAQGFGGVLGSLLTNQKCDMLVYNICLSVGDAALAHYAYKTEFAHPHTLTLNTPPWQRSHYI